MYTVAELIETLKQCPQDYEVNIFVEYENYGLESVGIDHDNKKVDLFDI